MNDRPEDVRLKDGGRTAESASPAPRPSGTSADSDPPDTADIDAALAEAARAAGFPVESAIVRVLQAYHARDRAERQAPRVEAPGGRDGGQDQRMRAVSAQTGQLMNIMARSLNAPIILELGTSFGYSGLWLAEAARATGGRLITMEKHAYKSEYARRMHEQAGLAAHVDYRVGDAVALIRAMPERLDFVFLDTWKDIYIDCLEAFHPKLNPGAIIVADNIIMPGTEEVKAYVRAIRAKPGITSLLLPVGSGLEVSRYLGDCN